MPDLRGRAAEPGQPAADERQGNALAVRARFDLVQPGLGAAVASGLVPFLPADLFKVFVAAAVLPATWKLLR